MNTLIAELHSVKTWDVLRRYADATGREVEGTSALVYLGVVIGLKDNAVLARLNVVQDANLMEALSDGV